MKIARKLLCLALAGAMILSLAACGDQGSTNSGGGSTNTNVGVRLDADGNLLYKPEDVGEIDNPIVTGLIAPAPDDAWYAQEIGWKEDAYGIEYDYDSCPWTEREMKWVASYVAGTAYDIIQRITYPTTVVKGLVQPLDDILPVNDERYFRKTCVWNGKTYGVYAKVADFDYYDIGELYGVWLNLDLFEENGVTSPVELFENGEWDFNAFENAAKSLTIDTDRDGVTDIYGWASWVNQMFTIANGASTISPSDTQGLELTWNTPAYINGLEALLRCQPYSKGSSNSAEAFNSGTVAMYIGRAQAARKYSPDSPERVINFEADWIPFPKGPDGEGYMGSISSGSEYCCIGTGAKNIEGAKVFICADICKFDYVSTDGITAMIGVTDEMIERARTCDGKIVSDLYSGVGNLENTMYTVWSKIKTVGVKAAIDQFTPVFQKQIDILLAENNLTEQEPYKSPGLVDFENDNIVLKEIYENTLSITTDPNEVINGSKSLKIQLVPDNDYGPVAVTTSDNYSMPFGGQYKISFKAKAVGGTAKPEGSFLVEFRPSSDISVKDNPLKFKGYNPVDLSSGEVVDVEIMINVIDFYEDLQLVLIGNTDESAPELAVIIDDLAIELIQ